MRARNSARSFTDQTLLLIHGPFAQTASALPSSVPAHSRRKTTPWEEYYGSGVNGSYHDASGERPGPEKPQRLRRERRCDDVVVRQRVGLQGGRQAAQRGAQRALHSGFHRGGRSARRSVSRTTFDANVQRDARAAGTYGLSAIKLMAARIGMSRT